MALTEIDRDLVRRCLGNEFGAWQDFVDRFLGLVVHVINHTAEARSMPLAAHDVDDVCAEVFSALVANDFAALRNFRGNASLATYLTVVARRVTVRELIRRQRVVESSIEISASSRVAADKLPIEDRIADREEVEKMINGLSDQEQTVVRLYHLEGRSYREISTAVGISENAIGPTLSRARAKMRRAAEAQA